MKQMKQHDVHINSYILTNIAIHLTLSSSPQDKKIDFTHIDYIGAQMSDLVVQLETMDSKGSSLIPY